MKPAHRLTMLPLIAALAAPLAACGDLRPQTAQALADALGDALPGARGLTEADQEAIDDTVARGCAPHVRIWTWTQCAKHSAASEARWHDLGAAAGG